MIKHIEKLKKQDPESTSYPYWVIIEPSQNMGKDIHEAGAQITGVFFSRKDAQDFLTRTRYNFSSRAAVYCLSGCYSEEWCELFDIPVQDREREIRSDERKQILEAYRNATGIENDLFTKSLEMSV